MASKLGDDQYDELCNIFLEVDESGMELNDRESDFFEEQRQRFERYGRDTYVSGKQWDWLRDIYKRATE